MGVDTSPSYVLSTSSGDMNVASFILKEWGISQEYQIVITIINPQQTIQLGEAVCFSINDYAFHGFVLLLEEMYSDKHHELNIVVISPLSHYLNRHETRIYPNVTLSELLHAMLTQAGLCDKLNYELKLNASQKRIWLQQVQENSLEFFHKLLNLYGLFYEYEQTLEGVKCVITDTRSELIKHQPIELKLKPISGLNGFNELSKFSRESQVCTQVIEYQYYDPDTTELKRSRVSSNHPYAIGKQVHNTVYRQSLIDEEGDSLWMTLQTFMVFPGQEVLVNHPMTTSNYTVKSMILTGFTEQTAEKRVPLTCEVMLSQSYSEFPSSSAIKPKPYSIFHLGRIEQRQSAYPNVSSNGEYCILFHHGQTEEKSFSPQWEKIRNALYYSGNHYGFSSPFQGATEVLIGYQNGIQHQPIILGALPTPQNLSLVTDKNQSDGLIQSLSRGQLLFSESSKQSSVMLKSADALTKFKLSQQSNESQFLLRASTGNLALNAFNHIQIKSQELKYYALEQVRFWCNETMQLVSEDGMAFFTSKTLISLQCQTELKAKSNEFFCRALNTIKLKSTHTMAFVATENLNIHTALGSQFWHTKSGQIEIRARGKLILEGGNSITILTPKSIEFQTPVIALNALTISGL
ncbi:contractile injection system protein, VgrG/Pvc8 family [Legionella impletisoli]|uniref:Gp5/Type VI secretion system Vgr protein OB-fold domain-containing protein n=1 Tax=Legionella impletisoli TaxID=343510 RepID=A0A917NBP9_9GAMM|nr:contractile injection system protein, VgrG/Pvc8 family [Legionella impletisoli]GGI86228.1 hypothetical protein GCM10007966_13530 [Legionella impletisoli]